MFGGALAGIGKAIAGGVGKLAGAAAGAAGGGGGGGGEGAGGILQGVGELVTGIIGAAKGGGEAQAAEGGGEAKAKQDPLEQLKAKLDTAKSPEEVDKLVAKIKEKLGKADPQVAQAVEKLAQEAKLNIAAEGI